MKSNELTTKKKVLRSILVFGGFVLFFGGSFLILYLTGAWETVNSVDKIRSFFQGLGFWGRLVFVIAQFLQVTIIPIPSTILTIAGSIIFGPLQASLLSLSGILLGSAFAFFLGRVFGQKVVNFMVGKETCEKWVKFLTKCKYSFFIMMLLPMFPDDILCLVAGLTDMSWTFFMVVNLVSRPIGVFLTCYLGSGNLIPYHGWGLAVWTVILLVVGVLIFLTTKYEERIEKFMLKLFRKKRE